MADIFREVDEEVRREQYLKLWKKYGWAVILLALLIVLGVGGYEAWKVWKEQQRIEASERYAAVYAKLGEEDSAAALEALAPLAGPDEAGYPLLAALEAAALKAEAGELEAAVADWRQIAQNTAAPPSFRAVARLLWVQHLFGRGDPLELQQVLDPLIAGNDPFGAAARELSALIALEAGDAALARERLQLLADDITAPSGLRSRATQLLATLPE